MECLVSQHKSFGLKMSELPNLKMDMFNSC